MPPRLAIALTAILALCGPAAAGCGDDEGGGGGGSGGGGSSLYGGGGGGGGGQGSGSGVALELTADPSGALKFDKTLLTAKAGKVRVELDNPSQVPHAIEVEGDDLEVAGDTVGQGGVSKVTADLQPGEYEYYCPVGNHKDAGMEGTLTVR